MVKRARRRRASRPHRSNGDLWAAVRVRAWRAELGWSVQELAQRANLPVITIERIEDADRPATLSSELRDIAHALGRSADEIFSALRLPPRQPG